MEQPSINWLFDELKAKDTKIAARVFNALNKDILNGIVVDGDIFWMESVSATRTIPNFVHDYIIRMIKNKYGLKYLYDNN